METLSIQIWKKQNHPLVSKFLSVLWNDKDIETFGVCRINDKEPRVSFAFSCKSATAVWKRVGKKFNKLPGFKACAVIAYAKDNDWINATIIQTAFDEEGSV